MRRAFVFITPREEEGVKVVVFQSARSNFTRAQEKRGLNSAEEARDQKREKKKIFQKGAAKVFRVYLLP